MASLSSISVIAMLSPFMLLPVVARTSSIDEWSAFVVGQSIGSMGGSAILYSWGFSGPTLAARMRGVRLVELYNDSLVGRLVISVVSCSCAGLAAALLVPQDAGIAILVAVAIAVNAGLTPSWYFIGMNRPRGLVAYETLPTIAVTAVSASLLVLGAPLWVYPLLLMSVRLVSVSWLAVLLNRGHGFGAFSVSRAMRLHRTEKGLAASQILASAYASGPVTIVAAITSPAVVARFSSADKMYRPATMVLGASVNALQSWVSEHGNGKDRRRLHLALMLTGLLGIIGGLGIAVLGVPASRLIFGPDLATTPGVAIAFAVAFVAVAANSASGRLILIPAGDSRAVLLSTCAGAIVGLPLMIACGVTFGATGVAWAFAASEIVVAAVQLLPAQRTLNRMDVSAISSSTAS
ncbi:hypothetical protein [Rhodococcus opacus]|nr:hypothetical protein [Rhodococcus opacus]ELB94528.1 polysaccharide biosynthesis protein [Rhodococcus wratislaviensis IFP 2016]NHU45682.1 hypothetical protein [Rhodococcus sp. A14]MDX5962930.1 hypothetical protein [Rhodococcus opacus]NKY69855.1 hypothetical protein [Rhodococcus opacus]CAG7599468.1 hypothetical protein E143388_04760 [Rhodococcus opacus]